MNFLQFQIQVCCRFYFYFVRSKATTIKNTLILNTRKQNYYTTAKKYIQNANEENLR